MNTYDVAVIGAGPAGLAAAVNASELGSSVVLIDANARPGGQYWRHHDGDDGSLHHGWKQFCNLKQRLDAGVEQGHITYMPSTQAWMAQRIQATPELDNSLSGEFIVQLTCSDASDSLGRPSSVSAHKLIVATGAYDRQIPFPGWDLPGVMAAGGVQSLIKGEKVLPGKRFIVAGTGPFLLPVAANIVAAGGEVVAVCEANRLSNWAPHVAAAAKVPEKALEGAEYAGVFAKNRIPYLTGMAVTRVEQESHGISKAVRLDRLDKDGAVVPGAGKTYSNIDVICTGFGFNTQVELITGLGAKVTRGIDGAEATVVDDKQQSTVPGLYVAGEVTGIGGASLAVAEGIVAGVSAAGQHPNKAQEKAVQTAKKTIKNHRAFAKAMHQAHPVPQGWMDWVEDDTVICRCEEVTKKTIVDAVTDLGAEDPRSLKSVTRTGMGWCQGRTCGFAAHCLTTGTTDYSGVGRTKRPVSIPVALGEIAELHRPHPEDSIQPEVLTEL
ncbi:NAD(P)/FAD-dependent oxidoreductase [Corynebacterium aquilae]|uniref:FAD/NAD(P)-dependent oxidoreductase n=1 Tax=Corynebacterium aquilae TaxID=203263 RepID=UPI000952E472|nr:NAD(P)/FAD-dependent oxidoreductase [Corynebacterium aquilae]